MEPRTQDPFEYVPLDTTPNAIRLLRILPDLFSDGRIQCEIWHSTTDATYTCFSYVWGTEDDQYPILLDGKSFTCRKNLWAFLNVAQTHANEFLYRNSFFFTPLRPYHDHPPVSTSSDVPMRCQSLKEVSEEDWNKENLMAKTREIIDGRKEGMEGARDVYHYLRMTLTGQERGMRLYDIMVILGRGETLGRLGVQVR